MAMKSLGSLALMVLMAVLATGAPLSAAPRKEALDRARASAEILARWAPGLEDGGTELRGVLAKLTPEGLAAAARAKSPADLRTAVFGRTGPLALGDDDSDLVFFPLWPCRLVDTRNTPTGPVPIAAGTARQFEANGNLAPQGGAAAGCEVPLTDPAALAVTITAINPQGPGNLRAYPAGVATPPNASVVNYGLPGSGLNLANTTILPLLQDATIEDEFAIRADVSTVHVVVDVVGYFLSPTRAPLVCETRSARGTISANTVSNVDSPACPAGTMLAGGGGHGVSDPNVSVFRSEPNSSGTGWSCSARSVAAGSYLMGLECSARCCSTPGR
jgi:hypothetical protein